MNCVQQRAADLRRTVVSVGSQVVVKMYVWYNCSSNRAGQNHIYIYIYIYIYIRCIYDMLGRRIIKYTVINGVCIRFWPTLRMFGTTAASAIAWISNAAV